jgi:beta-lactam-binding protein with PASTA domain
MPHEPEMPAVCHSTYEDARDALVAAGIPFRVSLLQSQTVADGDLISVEPRPGTILRSGMEATLSVSSGPPSVAVRNGE